MSSISSLILDSNTKHITEPGNAPLNYFKNYIKLYIYSEIVKKRECSNNRSGAGHMTLSAASLQLSAWIAALVVLPYFFALTPGCTASFFLIENSSLYLEIFAFLSKYGGGTVAVPYRRIICLLNTDARVTLTDKNTPNPRMVIFPEQSVSIKNDLVILQRNYSAVSLLRFQQKNS